MPSLQPLVRIGVMSGVFHPEPGGPPTYLYHLLPELRKRGSEIRVVTYGDFNSEDYGYAVERISRRRIPLARVWSFIVAAYRLAGWADVLFVQGYVLPLLLIRWRAKRVVVKVVSDSSWEIARRRSWTDLDVAAFQTAKHPPRVRLLRAAYTRAMKLADAVIAPSQHVAALVRGWGVPPERVHVIYNGIPASELKSTDRTELRRELGLPIDRCLLVSVGRLEPVKGVDVAIRALEYLPENCELVIVGDGSQRKALEALAAPFGGHVRFVGHQPQDITLRYLRAADVFVLSSHTEGLPHVVLEALSVGTPAVATAVGGSPEVLTDGVNGLLVPPNDPSALATAAMWIHDDAELSERLIDNGFARSKDFSWETTVAQTETLLGRP